MSQIPEEAEKFVSSKEGAALLGVDRQSFFYYADSRNVARREKTDGGKDHYEYSYKDLLSVKNEVKERLQEKRKRKEARKEIQSAKETGLVPATDWAVREDLPYIYAFDCDIYGIEYSVPATKTLSWLQQNNRAIRVMFDAQNRREIWGVITILPMEEDTIHSLVSGDMSEQEIEAKYILPYESGKKYSCYVTSFAVRGDRRDFVDRLLHSVMEYWLIHPEIHISKLYGFASGMSEAEPDEENDGLKLIKKFYFTPRYDLGNNAWELDLDRYNPSRVIQNFQKQLKEERKGLPS